MMEFVSESETGQDLPKPDRVERDEAYSTGAGRKAVEVPVDTHEDLAKRRSRRNEEHPQAPVGLEMETTADEFR